jgi:AraC-like DNA-binding protein
MTPHQYIVGRRLRAAAAALRASEEPVARIALDQGFGAHDISIERKRVNNLG